MNKLNHVFIATSLDGFIADIDGKIDWLNSIPNPDNSDMGYNDFITNIDAIIMGRNTFETVSKFEEWPYSIPVFVLSNNMKKISDENIGKVEFLKGNTKDILNTIHQKGYFNLYIDGGKTIQNFLKEDLIDNMVITIIPKLLGGGVPLFSNLDNIIDFECVNSTLYNNKIVQNEFKRIRN